MSLPRQITCTCAVCGETSNQTVLASTNTFGSPDLDLRPSEMMRSTMGWWLRECPHCGYVSKSLEDRTRVDRQWLRREEYLNCDGIGFSAKLAKRFYKFYLINVADGSHGAAFYAALHAAWVCDDKEDRENAVHCRKLALEQMDALGELVRGREELMVLRADIMRRAGLFGELIREYEPMSFREPLHGKIIAFQLEKARAGDVRCYRVSDVEDQQES